MVSTVKDRKTKGKNSKLVVEAPVVKQELIKLDLGCGPNKRPGFVGVDNLEFPGVDVVTDITKPWPWPDNSVEEAHCSHVVEHLTNFEGKWERVKFFNELYRVLIPGGKCSIIIPHWCSNRYYGDPTHREAMSEMAFYYLLRAWRLGDPDKGVPGNAPHADVKFNPNGYSCDFDAVWGYAIDGATQLRSQEAQQFAIAHYKEVILDLHATVTARK